MAETVADVLDDLRTFLDDGLAAVAWPRHGIRREHKFWVELLGSDPEMTIAVAIEDAGDLSVGLYAEWTLSDLIRQLAPDGPLEQRIGQQWIVFTFTGWEHEYRRRLEEAHGVAKDALKIPLFGDLMRLRNDVVHHHGIATAGNSGKCEVLARWVTVGSPIIVTASRYKEFEPRSVGRSREAVSLSSG